MSGRARAIIRAFRGASVDHQQPDTPAVARLPAEQQLAAIAAEYAPDPEPARRQREFGTQFVVRQSFEETMRQRGYGADLSVWRRRITEPSASDRRRQAAYSATGHTEILFDDNDGW